MADCDRHWHSGAAIGTLVLAVATYWLGHKTREVAVETRNVATRTGEELSLLREQTDGQIVSSPAPVTRRSGCCVFGRFDTSPARRLKSRSVGNAK